jgi:hypothetical protein
MFHLLSFLAFAFTVVGQTGTYSVSSQPNTVTLYNLAYTCCNTIGFLAHEKNVEDAFTALSMGDIITLDGTLYEVTKIERYTATSGGSLESGFVNIETGETWNTYSLGQHIYNNNNALVLQTCYDKGNGRLFIIASPLIENDVYSYGDFVVR